MKASQSSCGGSADTQVIESITGLSEAEAAKRLRDEGYNELPSQKKQNIFVT